jgi:hypothetical protein
MQIIPPSAAGADETKDMVGPASSGTVFGYQVQARSTYSEPQLANGVLLDQRWKTISFSSAPEGFGVPRGDAWDWQLQATYCYSYAAAQALRYWWLASARLNPGGGYCIETRLVKFKIDYSIKATAASIMVPAPDEWRN